MALPDAQELAQTPAAILASEITNVNTVLASRYAPGGTFADLVDELVTLGKTERRVSYVDLIAYRTRLYAAQSVQAIESKTGGIGVLDVRFHDNDGSRRGGLGW